MSRGNNAIVHINNVQLKILFQIKSAVALKIHSYVSETKLLRMSLGHFWRTKLE